MLDSYYKEDYYDLNSTPNEDKYQLISFAYIAPKYNFGTPYRYCPLADPAEVLGTRAFRLGVISFIFL